MLGIDKYEMDIRKAINGSDDEVLAGTIAIAYSLVYITKRITNVTRPFVIEEILQSINEIVIISRTELKNYIKKMVNLKYGMEPFKVLAASHSGLDLFGVGIMLSQHELDAITDNINSFKRVAIAISNIYNAPKEG